MHLKMIMSVAGAALLAATSAQALTLTNRDATEHKLVLIEGDAQKDLILKPSETLQDLCESGCVIQLTNGEEYEFDGTEVVSIEDGIMYLEEASPGTSEPEQKPQ